MVGILVALQHLNTALLGEMMEEILLSLEMNIVCKVDFLVVRSGVFLRVGPLHCENSEEYLGIISLSRLQYQY